MLSVKNLRKVYKTKKADDVVALKDISIDFPETGFVFLLGKSGSGKSTLLNAIGGLDKFDSGEIIIKGKSSKDFSQSDFDSYRNTFIGFIFQEYNILENFTVAKNLALALELQGKKADKVEVMRLLEQVEMQAYASRKPNQLSGGQKQRVAIARALIKNPEIIMADEPTGALDSNTGKQVMDTLKVLSKTKLVIVVSHDREFAELYGDRIIELKDGEIISDTTKKEVVAQETSSGFKIIDNDIVYIKKGQNVSENDVMNIARIIANKSKESDTFISFDDKANQKLKEGAKINDDGNKEKFMKTEPEDVKLQEYNPNSLKLIRSRLKFSDSFKMGASSLRNKVGKLIFTIILSFFAFTVFGVVDALSSWNRADSVYQAMQMSNQKNLVMVKSKKNKGSNGGMSVFAGDNDIEILQQKFPEYTFKGVAGYNSNNGRDIKVKDIDLKSASDNPFKETKIYGYVDFSQADLNNLGFELIYGAMPTNDNEIVISKHIMEKLIDRSESAATPITTSNIIGTKIKIEGFNDIYDTSDPNYYATIVGVVDTKTDFSKYANIKDEDVMKTYFYRSLVGNNYATIAYVTTAKYTEILNRINNSGNNSNFSLYFQENSSMGVSSKSFVSLNGLYTTYASSEDVTEADFYYDAGNGIVVQKQDYNYYLYDGSYRYGYTAWNDSVSRMNLETSYYDSVEKSSVSYLLDDANSDNIPDSCTATAFSPEIFAKMFLIRFKGTLSNYIEGDHFKDLGDDEVIVKANYLSNSSGAEAKYNDGTLKAYFVLGYSNGNLEESADAALNVVGVFANTGEDVFIMSTATKTKLVSIAGKYSAILSQLKGSDKDKELVKFCETYGAEGVRYTIQNSATDVMEILEDAINNTAKVFFYIAIVFAVFAAVLLMNFISTSISYKKREIGVLRALGARGSDVFGIFFNESTIIAFINFAFAAVATFIVCGVINAKLIEQLGFDIVLLNVGIRQLLLILAVSWGSAFIASLIPVSKISRKKPIDAINNR